MRNLIRTAVVFALLAPAFAASEPKLELRGKVRYAASRFRFLRVGIYRVESPFTAFTLTGPGGDFRFSKLEPGTYTLSVVRRGLGEVRRSVVVTPALADAKGVIRTEMDFSPAEAIQSKGIATVSRTQLTVPFRASQKYSEAETKLNRQDVPGARKLLMEAVKIAPQYTAAWNFLGVLSYQGQDLDKAEEYFRHALGLEKDAFEPNVNLAGVMLSKQKLTEALSFNEKAIEIRPKDALANAQLGMIYFYLGRNEEAAGHLEKAKAADPAHFSMPQWYLSRIYERRGDKVAAAHEMEELLALRPGNAQVDQWKRRLARLQSP